MKKRYQGPWNAASARQRETPRVYKTHAPVGNFAIKNRLYPPVQEVTCQGCGHHQCSCGRQPSAALQQARALYGAHKVHVCAQCTKCSACEECGQKCVCASECGPVFGRGHPQYDFELKKELARIAARESERDAARGTQAELDARLKLTRDYYCDLNDEHTREMERAAYVPPSPGPVGPKHGPQPDGSFIALPGREYIFPEIVLPRADNDPEVVAAFNRHWFGL